MVETSTGKQSALSRTEGSILLAVHDLVHRNVGCLGRQTVCSGSATAAYLALVQSR